MPIALINALYLSYEAYLEAAKEQYHCYAMPIGSSAGESYPWGPSFVKYLADGKTVSFEDIKMTSFMPSIGARWWKIIWVGSRMTTILT